MPQNELPARNLADAFFQSAKQNAARPALKADGGLGRCYTYDELAVIVRRLANGLLAKGPGAANEIGLIGENCPEWAIAYLAILAAGKTVVPIDANLKPAEIAYITGHAQLRLVIATASFESVLADLSGSFETIILDDKSPRSWLNHLATDGLPEPRHQVDTAALIYTSGTTGAPKAVELTHDNLLVNLEQIKQALQFDHTDVFLSILPLHHTFEATCGFLTPLANGSSIVYARSYKSKEIIEDIRLNRVTLMCGVPLLYEKIHNGIARAISNAPALKRAAVKGMLALSATGWSVGQNWGNGLFRSLREKAGLDTIRMFVSGGAALPPHINRFFNLLGFTLLQGYGLTETSPVVSVNRPGDIRFDSSGPLLDGIELKFVDTDPSGIGEIALRGRNIFDGYRDNQAETDKVLRDGWLFTGDLGCLKGGHLYITGRKKNIIVSAAGKNIYPEQLEEKLMESQFILECVVYGLVRPGRQGEQVQAIVVPDMESFAAVHNIDPGRPDMATIESVIAQEVAAVNSHMADYKRINDYTVQLGELEKTSTRKIKRFVYKQ